MPPAEPVLITAFSGRALAQSARGAGFVPVVLDAFGDLDMRAAASGWRRVPIDAGWCFEPAALLEAAEALAPPPVPLVWGSGFERQPDLLARLAMGRELLGCPPDVVRRAKDPFAFVGLCARLGLSTPETVREPPADPAGWLRKRAGGAGGAHVRPAAAAPRAGDYFQRRVPGRPVSALVIGDGRRALTLGFSEQWASPTPTAPYRYGGALAPAALDPRLAHGLGKAAAAFAAALGLRGLGGVDALVDGDGFNLLELNPRPGAALPVHERSFGQSLFGVHVAACRGSLPEGVPASSRSACAEILWAPRPLRIPEGFRWPAWAGDRGPPGTLVPEGGPVCTVHAQGASGGAARALAGARADVLLSRLGGVRPAGSRSASAAPASPDAAPATGRVAAGP